MEFHGTHKSGFFQASQCQTDFRARYSKAIVGQNHKPNWIPLGSLHFNFKKCEKGEPKMYICPVLVGLMDISCTK